MKISSATVIIVTGATRGFGRALTEDFARRGAKVYATYKSSDNAAKALQKEYANVHLFQVDSANPAKIVQFIKNVIEKEGAIDILINNAGNTQERKKIVDLSLDNWQNLINVHLTGSFLFCKNVLTYMLKRNSGVIINISSRFGLFENAKAEFGSLNVVKAGVNMLTKVIAQELQGTNIRINSVLPAPTLTDFLAQVFSKEEIENMRQKQILGEISECVGLVNRVIEDEKINGEFVLSPRLK